MQLQLGVQFDQISWSKHGKHLVENSGNCWIGCYMDIQFFLCRVLCFRRSEAVSENALAETISNTVVSDIDC